MSTIECRTGDQRSVAGERPAAAPATIYLASQVSTSSMNTVLSGPQ